MWNVDKEQKVGEAMRCEALCRSRAWQGEIGQLDTFLFGSSQGGRSSCFGKKALQPCMNRRGPLRALRERICFATRWSFASSS